MALSTIRDSFPALDERFLLDRAKSQRPARTIFALLGLMAVPVLLAVFFFAGQSVRLDESQSLWQSSRGAFAIVTLVAQDVHVPLYHLLLHFWRIAFGDTLTTARTLSLVLFVLNIPALYLLGKLAYNRSVGLFAALLFSISPFMNWYGSEIRMYTLFTLLVILNQYFFVSLFKARSSARGTASDHIWIGYLLTAACGMYTHYFFFLNLASQAVFFVLRRDLFLDDAFRRFMLTLSVLAATFAPWVWYVFTLGQAGYQEPVLAEPTSVNLFSTFSQFLFGFLSDHLNAFFLSLWPITLVFGFLNLRRESGLVRPETQYFLITLLVSVTLAFVGSFVVAPIFVSRYLIFTVPSLYLLLSSLFSSYAPRWARVARWSLASLMVVTLVLEILNPTTPVKENYAAASAYLEQHATAQDTIILSAPFTVYPVEYYYRGAATLRTLPDWNRYARGPIPAFSESQLPAQVSAATKDHQNVYLVLSYDQGYEQQIKNYFDSHFERTAQKNFSEDLNVYVYKLRYDTPLSTAGSQS